MKQAALDQRPVGEQSIERGVQKIEATANADAGGKRCVAFEVGILDALGLQLAAHFIAFFLRPAGGMKNGPFARRQDRYRHLQVLGGFR